MARLIALFDDYDQARKAALALSGNGVAARVTYLLPGADQGADGSEGFYPNVTPDEQPGGGTRLDPREGHPFHGISSHKYAVTGTESLTTSPSLEERLRSLGLDTGEVMRLLKSISGGRVAAVFRLDGQGEKAMAILAEQGAGPVEQLF